MSGYDFVYTKCLETLSEDHDGWCRCDVRWWSDTRTWMCRRSVRDTLALVF